MSAVYWVVYRHDAFGRYVEVSRHDFETDAREAVRHDRALGLRRIVNRNV